jgi:very-short-patch-repair endonuclease
LSTIVIIIIIFVAAIALLFTVVAIVASVLVGRHKPASPYERHRRFLTPAERSFFGVLRQTVGERYLVFAKVRVADLLSVRKGTSERQAHLNRIISKHVDFVLCDPREVSPLLMIELDDSSHQEQRRQVRDEFLDQAFAGAGLPLLRVIASPTYDQGTLSAAIAERISSMAGGPITEGG